MYDYIARTYKRTFRLGMRVKHTEINKEGEVGRENLSQSHYVMVRLDGHKHLSPCHPEALEALTP